MRKKKDVKKAMKWAAVLVAVGMAAGAVRAGERENGLREQAGVWFYERIVRQAGLEPSELESFSIGQSHIDAAWRWRKAQTRDKCMKTFRAAVKHMKEYPEFHYSQSAPQYYEWVKEDDPELFAEIQRYEREGRWEIVGGEWVEPDNNMPDGESFVRHRLYGQRFYYEHFGKIAEISWLLDSFGYHWNLPQILAKSGARWFWTNKLTWNDTTIFPFHLFHWQAPDGSRVLAYIIQTTGYPAPLPISEFRKYYSTRFLLPPGETLTADYSWDYEVLRAKMSPDWLPVIGIFYGKGDGGHGPTTEEIQLQLALRQAGFTRFARARELFMVLDSFGGRVPVWNDELYLEDHRGCLTTHGWIKRANREAEQMMRTAELVQTIAARLGFPYAYEHLKRLWKLVLFNQFHDILPGSSIPEVFEDAAEDYRQIQEGARQLTDAALDFLATHIDRRPPEPGLIPLVVFNPLSWERSGVARLALLAGEEGEVVDAEARCVLSQVELSAEEGSRSLLFRVEGVPSVGYKLYYFRPGLSPGREKGKSLLKLEESPEAIHLHNEILSAVVDKRTGWLTSLRLKEGGREFLAGPSNRLGAWRDRSLEYPAWNIQKDYLKHPLSMPEKAEVKVTAKGPLFLEVTARRRFSRSDIVQVIRLYEGDPRLHLVTRFDFHDRNVLVKQCFDTAISGPAITADIPYAVIRRPTRPVQPAEKARWEALCQKWLDLSDGEWGLALLNNGKYGYSLNEDGTGFRLTLLKAAIYPTAAPEAVNVEDEGVPMVVRELLAGQRITDQGRHTVETALYPHPGDWRRAQLWKAGYEFNTPLEVRRTIAGEGELPPSLSFLTVDNPGVYVGALKRAEDSAAVVVRLVEAEGEANSATVRLSPLGRMERAEETDLLEWSPELRPAGEDSLSLSFSPHEIKTLRLRLK